MPVPSFLSSLADKAQTAIQASPLAGHIPANRPTSPAAGSTEQSASGTSASPARGSHLAATLGYQFRSLQQQYGNANSYQRMITLSKGVSLDFDSLSRDIKNNSKELYTWGQTEAEDIKDVSDRLAYFHFVEGSLASTLSTKLDAARTPLKALRDAEANLVARRNVRNGYARDIKVETDHSRTNEKRVAELERMLSRAEIDDEPLEKEFEIIARRSIRESEQAKWDAIREYGEKLVILSKAASKVIEVLPSVPPRQAAQYSGAQATAAIRAAVQHALDHHRTGEIDFALTGGAVDLNRSDTRSFGETHASELSSIGSSAPVSFPSPHTDEKLVQHVGTSPIPPSTFPVIDPQQLNQTPATIPTPAHSTLPPTTIQDQTNVPAKIQTVTPTIAETGIPQSAGPEGPGPSSGTLRDVRFPTGPADSASGSGYRIGTGAASGSLHESAEDEKRRLEREERERILRAGGTTQPQPFESAEDEKKRLQRQERDNLLAAGPSQGRDNQNDDNATGEDLPPYKEF